MKYDTVAHQVAINRDAALVTSAILVKAPGGGGSSGS